MVNGARLYSPKCKVCNSPYKQEIEDKLTSKEATYRDIVRLYPTLELYYESVRNHYLKHATKPVVEQIDIGKESKSIDTIVKKREVATEIKKQIKILAKQYTDETSFLDGMVSFCKARIADILKKKPDISPADEKSIIAYLETVKHYKELAGKFRGQITGETDPTVIVSDIVQTLKDEETEVKSS